MKIILVHNNYQYPGGEDKVFDLERALLQDHGHRVVVYQRSNHELASQSLLQRLMIPIHTIWARDSFRQMEAVLRKERPDIVHVHNTFVRISPSILAACRQAGVPVVKTLHNFRLMCPSATFFRNGKICEECLQSNLLRSVRYGCYRQSRSATASIALALALHRRARTWIDGVTSFIALSRFSRNKFIQGGLPPGKIAHKPNFVHPDPGKKRESGYAAVYVGRLSAEKGLETLLRAWRLLPSQVRLQIFGDGPLRAPLERLASSLNLRNLTFHGRVTNNLAQEAIKGARLLICPSENYENFPLTIVEALSCGTPVVCSRLGAMQEIVLDGQTGLHFSPGAAEDLADKVVSVWDRPERIKEMGSAARQDYEQKYTAEKNYVQLMQIYHEAISLTRDSAATSEQQLQPALVPSMPR